MYLVVSGIVQVLSRDGGEHIPVAVRSGGCALGVISAVLGDRHLETARAWTPCAVECLDVATFDHQRRTDPRVALWVQSLLGREAQDYRVRTRVFMQADVRVRFEFVLADLIPIVGEPRADGTLLIRLPAAIEELAAAAGTARESLTRLLLKLETEGTVIRKGRWIIVPAGSPYVAFFDPTREFWTSDGAARKVQAAGSGSIRRDERDESHELK